MREKLIGEIVKQCEKTMKGWTVTSRIFIKNNQVVLHGIVIKRKDILFARVVYLESLEEILGDKFTAEQACAYIQDQALNKPDFHILQSCYAEWENIKGNIRKKLVNYGQNQERLKGILHRRYLDLAEVCYWAMDTPEGKGTAEVPATMPAMIWGVSEEEVFEMADRNMALEGYRMDDLRNILPVCLMPCEVEEPPLYVVRNAQYEFGAAILTRPDVLKGLLQDMDGNYYIFPSSTHEIILKKEDRSDTVEELRNMVREVNDTCVARSDFLSGNVYYYDGKTGNIKLCGNE